MKLVFVAGPYRAANEWDILTNVRKAEAAALAIWRLGASVICPHKNTQNFGGAAPDEVWLAGAIEQVRRSDAVFCVDNWEYSAGALNEVNVAKELGLPVFTHINDLDAWLKGREHGDSSTREDLESAV